MADTKCMDIAFIGSGAIHFGGAEGPWDHSARLEKMPGIRFVAIVDPDQEKANSVLRRKLSGPFKDLYSDCKVYPSFDDMIAAKKPGVVLLGVPPVFHGSLEQGKDLELKIVQKGLPLFVEKPLSVVPRAEFKAYVDKLEEARLEHGVPVSVGYMFRYHDGVLKMKELIANHGGKVMLFNARYYFAYKYADHPFWWDINKSGGPIVEQATHFCDLARFIAGDIDLDTVAATCLREEDAGGAGKLGHVSEMCEKEIPVEKRVPRITVSTWRFVDGGLGTLAHSVALHGKEYETSIDVLMDGLRMTLYEPYTPKCKLLVRQGNTDDEVVYDFGKVDPYEVELRLFLEAVRNGKHENIASPYHDAAKTYDFSWAIRLAGEGKNK